MNTNRPKSLATLLASLNLTTPAKAWEVAEKQAAPVTALDARRLAEIDGEQSC